MTNESSNVIEINTLSKIFKEVQAVDNLSMNIHKGEIYGFLGPNGAGKTTTIKMMMGLIHPTSGEIRINGQRVHINSVEIRNDIGYVPERVSFFENLTPKDALNFFCELKHVDNTIVKSLLRDVGLEKEATRKIRTFSKGMKQLLGLAQAMIGSPSIYIFDEPMSGLDARWVKIVRDKIKRLNEEGATIMFSSHILSEVQNLCDRVAIINKGKLVAENTLTNLSTSLHMNPGLEISVSTLDSSIPEMISKIDGVHSTGLKKDKLIVVCNREVRAKIISELTQKGVEILDLKTTEPSLEDVFVKLTTNEETSN